MFNLRLHFLLLIIVSVGLPADEWVTQRTPVYNHTVSNVELYVTGGWANYRLQQGNLSALAYALGGNVRLRKWLTVDLGYMDLGEVSSGSIPAFGLPEFLGGNFGTYASTRMGYAIPTFQVQYGRLSLESGIGAALAESRVRSYHSLFVNPKIAARTEEFSNLEWIAKVGFHWQATASWAFELTGYEVEVDGYNSYFFRPKPPSFRYKNRVALFGLSYSPKRSNVSALGAWELSVGPSFSWLSFHDNYHDTPVGYDLFLSKRIANRCIVYAGHTEYGNSTTRPRKSNGDHLVSPPFGYPQGDLLVKAGITYGLLGFEEAYSNKFALGFGAGCGRVSASFMSIYPAYTLLPMARYTDHVDRTAFLAQTWLNWSFSPGWSLGLKVRYSQFKGVQITSRLFEPDFGNTKIRTWSLIPSLGLSF